MNSKLFYYRAIGLLLGALLAWSCKSTDATYRSAELFPPSFSIVPSELALPNVEQLVDAAVAAEEMKGGEALETEQQAEEVERLTQEQELRNAELLAQQQGREETNGNNTSNLNSDNNSLKTEETAQANRPPSRPASSTNNNAGITGNATNSATPNSNGSRVNKEQEATQEGVSGSMNDQTAVPPSRPDNFYQTPPLTPAVTPPLPTNPAATVPASPTSSPPRVVTPPVEAKPLPLRPNQPIVLKELTINAVNGKDFNVALEGESWFPQTSRIDPALTFKGRDFDQRGRTVFRFSASKPGEYTMQFNRNGPNGLEVQTVTIVINEPLPPAYPTVVPPSISPEVKTDEVIATPALPSPVEEGVPATASSLLSAANNLDERALAQLISNTLSTTGNEQTVAQMADRFMQRFPRSNMLPEILYKIAQAYEQLGSNRNIEEAYRYYRLVFDNFPISPFSRLSKERIDHLNRFYLRIY